MFDINTVDLDWLTVTTHNPILSQKLMFYLNHIPQPSHEVNDARWLQYAGRKAHNRHGTIFVGAGIQNEKQHFAAWASGQMASKLWFQVASYVDAGLCKVTRLDLQLTVDYDRQTWQQTKLESALRDAEPDRVISLAQSASGPQGAILSTVYYGSRTSDRVVRIYEKCGMADEVFLRFEVELKTPRSQVAALALVDGVSPSRMLKGQIIKLPDVYGLHALFLAPLDNVVDYPIRTIKPESNTEKWLKQQVIPALDRILNDHDANHAEIAVLFRRVLDSYDSDQLDT